MTGFFFQEEKASPPSSREGEGKKYCHPESSEGTSLTSSSREGEGKKSCHPESSEGTSLTSSSREGEGKKTVIQNAL
jgi:hypothetical protein